MRANIINIEILKKVNHFVIASCLTVWLTQAYSDETEDYLSLISSEANKIDEESPPPETQQAAPVLSKQQEFEKVLMDQHRGSYPVYKRLTPSAKKEVFEAYESGVSFEKVRRKIITLYSKQK
jgi:hypothetical protein